MVHLPEDHRYGLGVAAYEVGSGYSRQAPLQRIARRRLSALVDLVGESAHLAVLHGRDVLYVVEERAPRRPSLVTDVGVRLPAHLTASGRAILAALPAPQVRALYPSAEVFVDRHGVGPRTPSALRRLLAETRRRGYAVEDGEVTPGLSSVAAVVRDHNGHPVAGLAVTFAEGTRRTAQRAGDRDRPQPDRTSRGRNRDRSGAVVSPGRSSEGAPMSSPERRSRRRLVWSGTVAAAVVASALSIPTSGAGSGTPSLAEANEARKASLGRPAPGPAGHAAAHAQRPGDQEPDLPRRRGRPQRPGPDHRCGAHRRRGVRRERAPAARPAAAEGAAPLARQGAAEPVRHGQRLLLARAASRSSSSRPRSVSTCSTTSSAASSSPVAAARRSPARPRNGRPARSATGSRSRTPGSGCGSRAPTGSRCASPRAAPATPRPTSTSTGRRSRASRRTKRCAGTSTGTPTGWRSSSSAAGCTAAGPGTSTARRTH